ncbi:hypothetical protein [Streptomyces sp. NPDC050538]|uniref:hypothetical protein n=1 Tax=Streptomyces sp. NPDC050538 TaxID=3365627 RepID=UPI0037959646
MGSFTCVQGWLEREEGVRLGRVSDPVSGRVGVLRLVFLIDFAWYVVEARLITDGREETGWRTGTARSGDAGLAVLRDTRARFDGFVVERVGSELGMRRAKAASWTSAA